MGPIRGGEKNLPMYNWRVNQPDFSSHKVFVALEPTSNKRFSNLHQTHKTISSQKHSINTHKPFLITNPDIPLNMATSSLTATGFSSSFHGSWGTSMAGEDYAAMVAKTTPNRVRFGKPLRSGPMMGNVNEGKGIFAPLVVITRNIVGKKRFNQLRGKAIALHSQVITEFCKSIGADSKQRQGLIRLAKKNGEKLGFLA